jgi:hypothetical protein
MKYHVSFERAATEVCIVEVEADSEEHAQAIANLSTDRVVRSYTCDDGEWYVSDVEPSTDA